VTTTEGDSLRRNALTTGLLTAALALGAPAAASADDDSTGPNCADPLIEHPFAPFGDDRDFFLAPGGSFDSDDTDWKLNDDARVQGGSLALRDDGRATSPAACVDLDHEIMRFKYRAPLNPDAELEVEVRYPGTGDSWMEVAEIEAGEGQDIGDGWLLSDDVPVRPELGGSEPGWRHVKIRFRGEEGKWRVDDVYVDPKRRS
jgi:hypothetical protein